LLSYHFFRSIIDRSLNSSFVFFSKEFIQRSGYDMEANARPLSRGFSSLVRVVFFVRKNGKKREKRERTSNGRHWHHWHHWDHSWQILTDSDRFLPEFESWSSWDLCQSRELEVKMEEGVKRQVQARDFEMFVKCLWNVMSWFVIYHNHIYIYYTYHCVSLCIIVYLIWCIS
jgi:hypothetical protein